ncbi:amidohydrolase family protein [Aspergillus tanneri]|uniref:Amidohydrolase-related domain-containing protein n=1 Tax=Aspergillus tanneri TaxID=1220188 RepID=A0A5M9MWK4_9EURO|nr:uncharacterized protein ATNIH1004_000169 [Aspergillus tanneri]KAA8651288.1 hypothetical protein ATNIH1004_000169 [Aspergillus tanneri]
MLYIHATIITVNPDRDIITDGAVLVRENRIKDIQKTSALLGRYPDEERYDLTGHIIIPGLVSTHLHTIQTLFRGTADSLELKSWLCKRIVPLQKSATVADAMVAVQLSVAELLKSGTTCFLESMVSGLGIHFFGSTSLILAPLVLPSSRF